MNEIDWSKSQMLEIRLKDEDSFLKIAESLTRIGISNKKTKTIFQTCHILHKRGFYFLVHFKELFALDGKGHTINAVDIGRRNKIAKLLQEWGLCTIIDERLYKDVEDIHNIHIIKYSDKEKWKLQPKYKIGIK